jgi:hypothetical protein
MSKSWFPLGKSTVSILKGYPCLYSIIYFLSEIHSISSCPDKMKWKVNNYLESLIDADGYYG